MAMAAVMIPGSLSAQLEEEQESECAKILRKAQKDYDDGLIEKVEQKITPCLNGSELTKEEKLQGYKLLTLSKLYDEKQEEAEEAMIKFLSIDPEYEIQPGVDPKEFSDLFADFHTSPLYTIGGYVGLNWTYVNSYLERGVYNTAQELKEYTPDIQLQFGFTVSRYIYNGFNAHLDLAFVQNKYTYTHTTLGGLSEVTASEFQTILSVPVSITYTFRRFKTIRPYVRAGFGLRYMIAAEQADQVKSYPGTDIAPVTGPNIDIKNERNALMFEGIFGGGVKYKIPRGDIFLDVRYAIGLGNQRNESSDQVLNDDERLWDFDISDNDFTLNSLYGSVGFNYYLYKPRKKKEKNE